MGCSNSKDVEQDPWLLCFSGQVRQLERWLARGGNPCALDRQGGRGTLLHAAARGDQAECIRVLVKAGADVNAVTKLRGSPLHAAAQHGTGHAVQALLDNGADPFVKNAEGKTPIDLATAYGFNQTAARMRSVGRPRPNSGQLDSLLPPSASTQYYGTATAASGPRHSGGQLQPGGPQPGARPSPRGSPGPATPVGRISPSPGAGAQRQPGYPPSYPPMGWQAAQGPAALGSPPLNAWASSPTLPVSPQPEQPMAVSASGPAAVATPQAQQARDRSPGQQLQWPQQAQPTQQQQQAQQLQQPRDRSPAVRLSDGGTPGAGAARASPFPGSVSLPPPASQPAEIFSEPSPSAPPGTMSMIGDALGAPGWWMHQGGAGNGAAPASSQAHQAQLQRQQQAQQQRSRPPSPALQQHAALPPVEEGTVQAQQQLPSGPGQEQAGQVPPHPLMAQLLSLDGGSSGPPSHSGPPSLPPPGSEGSPEVLSAASSDGLLTKSSTLSEDPLLDWIGSQLATHGGSTLLTGMPPAAQQVQLARQLAQQAQQQQVQQAPPVQQQAPPVQPQTQQPTPAAAQQQVQQPAQTAQQQQAEQSSAGSGRSSGSAAHNGSGASNGAVRGAGHLGSGGSGGGTSRAVTPTGGSSNPPTRTSTLGSAGSLMVDIRPWEISYKQLTLLQSIGAGSFGKVYKAKWHETLVAVKVLLDLENVNDASMTLSNPVLINLHKECSLMASLRHPNIVQFMGVCSCPPAMITEFCGKGSLTDVLKAGKASPAKAALLSWQRRLNMALDAAKGMLYLHKRGIVHRDLKSPNLLVDQVWRVKVADFNLSKLVEGTDSCNSKTGTMAGANPKWLAPEVIGGFSATEKGDVFSYGVVLWELLTWEIPWNKVSPWTVVATLMNGGTLAMPPLDDATQPLPGSAADNATFAPHLPAYTALIKRCWAHNQFDRPSFEEVIHDLRSICEGLLRAPAGEAQQ